MPTSLSHVERLPRQGIAARIVELEHSRTFRLGPLGDDPIIAELRDLRAELGRREVEAGRCPACAQGLSWDGRTAHVASCPEYVA